MFKVRMSMTESTGAGYGLKPHVYVSGYGVGMSKSPKKAKSLARIAMYKDLFKNQAKEGLPVGIGLIPIDETFSIERDGKNGFNWRR